MLKQVKGGFPTGCRQKKKKKSVWLLVTLRLFFSPPKFQAYQIFNLAYYPIKDHYLDAQAFPSLWINRSKLLHSVLASDRKQTLAFPCCLLLKNEIPKKKVVPRASLVLVQCFPCSGKNKLKYHDVLGSIHSFLSVQFSALKLAMGQVNAKTNLSFTAVEILKP